MQHTTLPKQTQLRGNAQWHHTMLTQHWFNRTSHLHLLSHSFSATLLIVKCWQCCYIGGHCHPFTHWSSCCGFSCHRCVGFIGLKLLFAGDDTTRVTNDKCEGERQCKFWKNQYLLNTHLTLTLPSKQFCRQPSWSMKVSDNDNCLTLLWQPQFHWLAQLLDQFDDAYELTSALSHLNSIVSSYSMTFYNGNSYNRLG